MNFRRYVVGSMIALLSSHALGVEKKKTECIVLFKKDSLVGVYCPRGTDPKVMVDEFIEAAPHLNNGFGVNFDVFDDKKRAPKSNAEYLRQPDKVPYETYFVSIVKGKVFTKECYQKMKAVSCNF